MQKTRDTKISLGPRAKIIGIKTRLNHNNMFEATIQKAVTLKKIIDAIKELVTDAKFECTASGISLQAMDNAHVSLVGLILRAAGFENYRCDRNITLGLNLESLAKVLKVAGNDDSVTIRAEDDGDTVSFTFSSTSM